MTGKRHPVSSRADARVARAVEEVLRLDAREQRQAFLMLAEYLGTPVHEEGAQERVARQRAEALEDLRRVAARLGLPNGQGPTRAQYESLAEELKLRYPASAVTELWNGRWSQAKLELRGGASYESEQMLTLRARARHAARADPERRERYALECLRKWLDESPAVRHAAAYGRWVKRQNDGGAEPPPYGHSAIYENLSIDFAAAVAVAEGRLTLAQARAEHERRHALAETIPLVERAEVARLLDVRPSRIKQLAREGRLPPPIRFGLRRAVWLRTDIQALRDGRTLSPHDRMAERRKWLSTQEVAELLRIPVGTVLSRIRRNAWHQVPRPAHHVQSMKIWRREDVESWIAERDERD